VLRGPQSALETCSIVGVCYWVAVGIFVSSSVALAIERRSMPWAVRECSYGRAVSNTVKATKICALVPFHHSEDAPYMYASPPRQPSQPLCAAIAAFYSRSSRFGLFVDTSSSCRAPFTRSLVLFLAPGSLVSSLTPMCRVVNDNIHRQGNYAYVTAPAAKFKGVWGELGLANKGCSSLA